MFDPLLTSLAYPKVNKVSVTLPPAKLKAQGLTDNSINLLRDYLSNRKQRVKIGNNCNECQYITQDLHLALFYSKIS